MLHTQALSINIIEGDTTGKCMDKLTFKQHLDAKSQLLKAIDKVPERTATYKVKKYCNLVVGESKDEKKKISLKPKQKIHVKWKYVNETPDLVSIQVEDAKDVNPDETFSTYWRSDRLIKWLNRNANEESK